MRLHAFGVPGDRIGCKCLLTYGKMLSLRGQPASNLYHCLSIQAGFDLFEMLEEDFLFGISDDYPSKG